VQNYAIAPGHQLILGGRLHAEGDVLPQWYADRDSGLAARLKVGCLVPTSRPATAGLPAPAAKVAEDPTPGLLEEVDRLGRENAAFAASNKALGERNAALEGQVETLTKALGEQTAENAHLRAACDDHQAAREALEKKVAELTAELEAATAPAADGDATPPAKGKPKTS
jgi:hypothetical protein